MSNVLVQEETLKGIADAIREKNGTSGLYKPREMPEAILEIETYSGDAADLDKPIRFYGAYGELVYSYSYKELEEMTVLPALPEYRGLICQGWNWSLEGIRERGGEVEVGSLYITDDGATRIYIELIEEALNPKVGFTQFEANSVWIDWGDGSELETSDVYGDGTMVSVEHQYAEAGQYVIRLIPNEGAVFEFVGDAYSTRILHKVPTYSDGNRVYGNTIKKIEIGRGMTEFTGRCFNSYSLEIVTIPDAITVFLTAFQGCRNLRSLTFPKSVTQLTTSSVLGCYGLEKVFFSENGMQFGTDSFNGCISLKNVVIPKEGLSSYGGAFEDCATLRKVVFPETMKRITTDMFSGCSLLNNIKLPDSITAIGGNAFRDCVSLMEIDIPENVTLLESGTFYSCHSLRKVKLPQNLIGINTSVFYNCYSLKEMSIPESVTSIQANAFSGCKGMENYYLLPTTPPTLANVNAFNYIPETCKIHVPNGCLEAYQTAANWSALAGLMVEMEV